MKKTFIKVLLLLMFAAFSLKYISCKKRNLGTYFEVKFEVNSKEFAKYFVEEGGVATPVVAPIIEDKTFVFWMLNNKEYDFSKEVTSNLVLVAKYDDAAAGSIPSSVLAQLELIVSGAEFAEIEVTPTENLKAEYTATKDGKVVTIYYLEKENRFTTVKLYVGLDEEGKIVNMVTTQSDTIGKGENFNGEDMGLNGATSTTVDDSFVSVSGATISSNTVKELIALAFEQFFIENPDLVPSGTVTITFDTNGGTTINPIEVEVGTVFVRPNDPTRDLYHFIGWTLNGQPYDFEKPVVTNITLVAQWVSVFQFDSKTQAIVDAIGLSGDIVIPATINGVEVKNLGENLFKNNTTITSVVIPEGIENIEFGVFEGCTNLSEVTFLGTAESETLTFGINIFAGCTSLVEISLPANTAAVTSSMFEGCTALMRVNINGPLDHIGTFAFKDCENLLAVALPEGLKSIESNAFENCVSLISITFPSTLTKISEEAFVNCKGLISLYIPQGVTNINLNAFTGCENLVTINVSDANKNYSSIDGALYNKSQTTLYLVPNKSLTTFEVKSTVTSIQVNALANLVNLETITVEDGSTKYLVNEGVLYSKTTTSEKTTTKIEFIPAKYSGAVTLLADTNNFASGVFANCPNVTEIIIADGNEFFFEIDHLIYRKASATSTYYTLVVANRNFNGVATILKDTTGTLSSIDANAFTNTTLTGIRYTSSAQITSMYQNIFTSVPEEFKIYIPNGQTNFFVGTFNSKWSADVKAALANMIVEDPVE